MKLYAVARDKYDVINGGSYTIITRDYPTKKEFLETLKSNGFIVRKIYTEKQWQRI